MPLLTELEFLFIARTTIMPPRRGWRSVRESQRDSVPKPKVARHELPWVSVRKLHQPQRGCGNSIRRHMATTSLRLFSFSDVYPR